MPPPGPPASHLLCSAGRSRGQNVETDLTPPRLHSRRSSAAGRAAGAGTPRGAQHLQPLADLHRVLEERRHHEARGSQGQDPRRAADRRRLPSVPGVRQCHRDLPGQRLVIPRVLGEHVGDGRRHLVGGGGLHATVGAAAIACAALRFETIVAKSVAAEVITSGTAITAGISVLLNRWWIGLARRRQPAEIANDVAYCAYRGSGKNLRASSRRAARPCSPAKRRRAQGPCRRRAG